MICLATKMYFADGVEIRRRREAFAAARLVTNEFQRSITHYVDFEGNAVSFSGDEAFSDMERNKKFGRDAAGETNRRVGGTKNAA